VLGKSTQRRHEVKFIMKYVSIAGWTAALFGVVLMAQSRGPFRDGDWPMYARDPSGAKYSPLAQINTQNVTRLNQVWSVRLAAPPAERREGAPPNSSAGQGAAPNQAGPGEGLGVFGIPSNPEVTPIIVGGVLYMPAPGNKVLALDAETGKELWRHELPAETPTSARGVAYWPGDRNNPARILLTA